MIFLCNVFGSKRVKLFFNCLQIISRILFVSGLVIMMGATAPELSETELIFQGLIGSLLLIQFIIFKNPLEQAVFIASHQKMFVKQAKKTARLQQKIHNSLNQEPVLDADWYPVQTIHNT